MFYDKFDVTLDDVQVMIVAKGEPISLSLPRKRR